MSRTLRAAAVFPGQGSQAVGMGGDIARKSAAARAVFDRANGVLGYDLFELMQTGPEEKLRETQYSQPAIFVVNLALYEAGRDGLDVVASAGHSFGEFCSLTIAESISFDDALHIVSARGKAMQRAAEMAAGAMSAVIGFEAARIREIADRVRVQTGMRLQLANFNSPSQIVISGDLEAVRAAGDAMAEAGAKRIVPLNVSGAWHSALMEPAIEKFSQSVNAAAFALPKFAVISNVDAQKYTSVEQIKHNLVRSITDEVRWHDTALELLRERLDIVVEFGANPVLGPLMRRLPDAPDVANVSDGGGIEKLQKKIGAGLPA
ncbi:MAG: ACP S-malonyltransferase [Candidatus Eremiobacteraeota bacterium]|nr:ACP S-malonyltransferase [Candidatus Eremiobacteraeota bacterium]